MRAFFIFDLLLIAGLGAAAKPVPAILRVDSPKAGAGSLSVSFLCGDQVKDCFASARPIQVTVSSAGQGPDTAVEFNVPDPGRTRKFVVTLARTLKAGDVVKVIPAEGTPSERVITLPADGDVPLLLTFACDSRNLRFRTLSALNPQVRVVDNDGNIKPLVVEVTAPGLVLPINSYREFSATVKNEAGVADQLGEGALHFFVLIDGRDIALGSNKPIPCPAPGFAAASAPATTPPRASTPAPTATPAPNPASGAAPAAVYDAPTIVEPVKPGNSFDVVLGHRVADPRADVDVFMGDTTQATKPDDVLIISDNPMKVTVKLADKLASGQRIHVSQKDSKSSNIATVADATKIPQPGGVQQVSEGDTSVSGEKANGLDKVHVEVLNGDSLVAAKDATVDSSGNFSVSFDKKLNADERIQLTGVKGDQESDPLIQTIAPVDFDYGRVRSFFTFGALLSKDRGNFSEWDPFVSFSIDKQWLAQKTRSLRPSLHSYFDARLTAIPTTGVTTTTATDPAKTVTLDTFTTSEKAGALTTGVYLPFTVTRWRAEAAQYSLYLAPLVKLGFVTPTSTPANGLSANRFFVNYGYGVRIGHNREFVNWDGRLDSSRAPEPITHMDLTLGRYGNFENVLIQNPVYTTGANGAKTLTSAEYIRYRPWRLSAEGILKLPHSPFLLGVSANIGFQRIHEPYGPNQLTGFSSIDDDLRFLFGARFDMRKLLNKLGELGGN
jgi:hypothetical protein